MEDVKRKIQEIKDKKILQKNSNKIDLKKRDFFKKSVLGLAGVGGIALLSKIPFVKPWTFTTSGASEFDSISTDTISEKTAANGVVIDSVTLKDGNVVLGSGNGIDFSATADSNGGMTGETLDDYEKGVYTPTFNCSTSGSYTPNSSWDTLNYRIVGDLCFVHGQVDINAEDSPTGTVRLGLPVTAAAGTELSTYCRQPFVILQHGGTHENHILVIIPSVAYADMYVLNDDGTVTAIDSGELDATFSVCVSFFYPI